MFTCVVPSSQRPHKANAWRCKITTKCPQSTQALWFVEIKTPLCCACSCTQCGLGKGRRIGSIVRERSSDWPDVEFANEIKRAWMWCAWIWSQRTDGQNARSDCGGGQQLSGGKYVTSPHCLKFGRYPLGWYGSGMVFEWLMTFDDTILLKFEQSKHLFLLWPLTVDWLAQAIAFGCMRTLDVILQCDSMLCQAVSL